MKISEMTLEQLQDYALNQEEQLNAGKEREAALTTQITELTGLNKELQRRNNELFMKVEQTVSPEHEQRKEIKTESCEEFAKNYILGGNKK